MKKLVFTIFCLSFILLSSSAEAVADFHLKDYIVESGGANYGTGYSGIFLLTDDSCTLEQNMDWVKFKGPLKLSVIRRKFTPAGEVLEDVIGETYSLSSLSNTVIIRNYENPTVPESTFIYGIPHPWTEDSFPQFSNNIGIAYAPFESNTTPLDENGMLNQIENDIQIIKRIGFKIVKLWHTDTLYFGYWPYGDALNKTLDLFDKYNLPVYLPLVPFNYQNFPYDEKANQDFAGLIEAAARIAKKHPSVKWLAIWMPGNGEKVCSDPQYKYWLEQFASAWKANFPGGEVRLFIDADPYYNKFPKDFSNNVTGFGIQPYSLIFNDIDAYRTLKYYDYFSSTGKTVYIDEYGFRTNRNSKTGWHGIVSNEGNKSYLIKKYRSFMGSYLPSTYFVYFMLFDRNNFGEGDWGILNLDRTWRLSAYSFWCNPNGIGTDGLCHKECGASLECDIKKPSTNWCDGNIKKSCSSTCQYSQINCNYSYNYYCSGGICIRRFRYGGGGGGGRNFLLDITNPTTMVVVVTVVAVIIIFGVLKFFSRRK